MTLAEIWQYLKQVQREIDYEVYCEGRGENPVIRAQCTWHVMSFMLASVYCHFAGHDWEDHSWGGTESGAIEMDCKRCAAHFGHTLY